MTLKRIDGWLFARSQRRGRRTDSSSFRMYAMKMDYQPTPHLILTDEGISSGVLQLGWISNAILCALRVISFGDGGE